MNDSSKDKHHTTDKLALFQLDVSYSMIRTMVALSAVGAYCGYHTASRIILFPSWVGGLLGLCIAAISCTLRSGRGDLARSMGAKVAAFGETVIDINDDLAVAGKLSSCIGLIVSHLLIFDRKHKVKDKLSRVVSFVGGKAGGLVSGVREDMEEAGINLPDEGGPF